MKQTVEAGNIGIITTLGQDLHEVTGTEGEIVHCKTLDKAPVYRSCLARDFWVLWDRMP